MAEESIIHIVDDDRLFQTAISRLLRALGYEVRTYRNAGDFLLAPLEKRPGCILLDVRMPGPSGLELQKALASRDEPLPIIFLSAFGDVATAVQAIKGGAVDFLTKPVKRETLALAIERALSHDAEARILRRELKRWQTCLKRLTECEAKVFAGVVAGKMNKEIADELGAAERTVKAHRARVMDKMGAHSLAELVHIADQIKLERPEYQHHQPV